MQRYPLTIWWLGLSSRSWVISRPFLTKRVCMLSYTSGLDSSMAEELKVSAPSATKISPLFSSSSLSPLDLDVSSAALSIQTKILAAGDEVRNLKTAKAPADAVQAAVSFCK